MDVLSGAIAAMRTGRPHFARVRQPVVFGRRLAPVDGAGFHAVVQGSCWLIPPDRPPIPLRAGDVAFLPRGSGHGLADTPFTPLADPRPSCGGVSAPVAPDRADGSGAGAVLMCGAYMLDRSRSHPLLGELPEVVHLPAGSDRYPALQATVALLAGELERPGPGAEAVVPSLLDTLLLYLLRAWFTEQADQRVATGWAAALHDPQVAAALRAIHADPGRQWTVEGLGQRAGLSRAAFARRFTGLVGQPPLTYLTWWRMTTAAGFLLRSDAPLSAIARRIGYTSEFAFATAFKRAYGMAPGTYRRRRPTPSGTQRRHRA